MFKNMTYSSDSRIEFAKNMAKFRYIHIECTLTEKYDKEVRARYLTFDNQYNRQIIFRVETALPNENIYDNSAKTMIEIIKNKSDKEIKNIFLVGQQHMTERETIETIDLAIKLRAMINKINGATQ